MLFGFYFLLLTWLVTRTGFFIKMPVPIWVLAFLFVVKVAAGIYYGWFFTHMPDYKVQADTWRMYYESLVETDWIKKDPAGFIADLFRPRYRQPSEGILATSHSYWNDIKSVLIVKLMAVCNLLSGGRYYVNVLFFEYLSFFGPVALCRLFIQHFPQKKWWLVAGAFLFPSTLLWCSGFHKEGLLLNSLAMCAWIIHHFLQKKRLLPGMALLVFHLLIVFLLRNYLALFFVVWSIPWLVAYRLPAFKWLIFPTAAISYCMLFFATGYTSALPNLPAKLAARQQEFLQIPGESIVQPVPLGYDFKHYAALFPKAVANGFLQPLPLKLKKATYLPAAMEIVVFVLLLIHAIYFLIKKKRKALATYHNSTIVLLLFCLFFAASSFLLIGYIIPYLGAIVRYKAVVWPFIILPLLAILPNLNAVISKKNMKS